MREVVLATCRSGRACRPGAMISIACKGRFCDLFSCLRSVALCACSSHLGPNLAASSIVKEDLVRGMEKVDKKCLAPLSTPLCTFFLWDQSCTAVQPQSIASGLANSSGL